MFCQNNIDIIYEEINNILINIFCFDCNCKVKETELVDKTLCKLLKEDFYHHSCDECCDCRCKCISLVSYLVAYIDYIEECTNCGKNYGYLAQINRLKCILENLEKLLCQLKCLQAKDCHLLAKVLCVLFEILETIASIIAKLKNIECLCDYHLCCKADILECMLCNLVNSISNLEESVSELAHLVIELTSLNIINCTSCTVSKHAKTKNKDYIKDYCDQKSLKYFD